MANKDHSVLCTICARGGSKGVKNKNIRPLLDKPLIVYTIEQAFACELFEHVVVSTDDEKIMDVSREAGAEILFRRPSEMATDDAAKLPVIKHAFRESEKNYGKEYPYIVDLDATSPLRIPSDIREAFEQFLEQDNDNLFSVRKSLRSPYFNMVEQDEAGRVRLVKPPTGTIARRQDAPQCYDMNASLYIWKRQVLLEEDGIFLDNTGLYVMPEERSIDLDCELDFQMIEFLKRKELGIQD